MKRLLLFIPLFLPLFGFGQLEPKPEISVMSGYMWGGSLTTTSGDLKISDGQNWAFTLGVPLPQGITAELIYVRLDSDLRYKGVNSSGRFVDSTLADLSTNYFQIGGLRELQTGTNLVPYGVFALGATLFSPKSTYSDEWVLSFSLGGGLKYYFSDRIGIKVDGRFLFPLYLTGGGFFCGTGGCGLGIGSSSVFLQGFVDGGIILRLGS